MRRYLMNAGGVWFVAIGIWLPPSAQAATIHPNRTDDLTFVTPAGCGRDSPDTEHCSLREAILAAQPGDTISLDAPAPAGPYTLTEGELRIEKSLTIAGGAVEPAVVRAGGPFRVLTVAGSAHSVVLRGLTIRDGAAREPGGVAEGGGVLVLDASLKLEHSTVTHNQADATGAAGEAGGVAEGGGIMNRRGFVEVIASTISGNSAASQGGTGKGGGLALGGGVQTREGTFKLLDSKVAENTATARGGTNGAGGVASGGGLQTYSSFTVTRSAFEANTADARGGPAASGLQGGGLATGGALTSYTAEGKASELAGATFERNVADASGGTGSDGGVAEGGGLYLNPTGISVTVTNATIGANLARSLGTVAGTGVGGGIAAYGTEGPITIRSTTLDLNTAEGPTSGGGDLEATKGVSIANTIIGDGISAAGHENCSGEATSLGHNLDSHDQCRFNGPGDLVNTPTGLGALQDNGGAVRTQALQSGSAALNAGATSACPMTDARGVTRPQGNACDIGAFELATPSATTAPATAIAGTSATLHGVASNTDVLSATVVFQWGTSTTYGSQTPAQTLAAGASNAPVASGLSGLAPGTLYHFRAVASNAAGSSYGSDQTFRTDAGTPSLGTVTISPARFRPQPGRGASIARRTQAKGGATVSYTDTEAALTTFVVFAQRRGHTVGHRCAATSPRRRTTKGKGCTLYIRVGMPFTHADTTGSNLLHFTGRVSGRPLPAGRYRLRATAKNSSGLVSIPRTTPFKIF